MSQWVSNLSIFIVFSCISIGCGSKKNAADNLNSPPAPIHDGMCELVKLGEASSAVEQKLPDNQYVEMEGMSSPKTLVWQDLNTKQLYFAAKVMGAEGKLFYMDELKVGETPQIKTTFTGTLLLWKHLPKGLLRSMKKQFKEQWGVDVDENTTYIIKANKKPDGCK